uniref:Uncharacterized protein n=1 Tax=viral metagenome TaxID=1070528 RepID=A0A6C0BCF7_9ZZZZ
MSISTKDVDKIINNSLSELYPEIRDSTNKKTIPTTIPITNETMKSYEVLGYKLSEEQYKEGKIFLVVIIFIIILILIFFLIWILYYRYYQGENTNYETPEQSISQYDLNFGGIINRNDYYKISGRITKKMKNTHQLIPIKDEICKYGYYGPNCNLQAHDFNFYNAGVFKSKYTVTKLDGKYNLSLDYSSENGKYDDKSCTSTCKVSKDCKGVRYNHKEEICMLITSNIQGEGESSLNFNNENQIYLKREQRPHFTDKITGFSGSRLQRYYIDRPQEEPKIKRKRILGTIKKLTSGIVHFKPYKIDKLNWIPTRIANFGGYVGLWSTKSFNEKSWSNTQMSYVDKGMGEYNLPTDLLDKLPVFVLYVTKEDFDKNFNSTILNE